MAVVIDKLRHPEKAHRPETPVLRKPEWIRVKAPNGRGYGKTREIVRQHGLHTVCEEAGCPNIGECWEQSHATMMIMGDTCTRACAFCNVRTGMPDALDAAEPTRVAEAVAKGTLTLTRPKNEAAARQQAIAMAQQRCEQIAGQRDKATGDYEAWTPGG